MPGARAAGRRASVQGAPDGEADVEAVGSALAAGDPLGSAGADGVTLVTLYASPSRGAPSADSVKIARAFQIIQPCASLSAAACISARTCEAVYGAKLP